MQIYEVPFIQFAVPVVVVILCVFLVFAFGFKSPGVPPSLDVHDDDDKLQKGKKSSNKKPQSKPIDGQGVVTSSNSTAKHSSVIKHTNNCQSTMKTTVPPSIEKIQSSESIKIKVKKPAKKVDENANFTINDEQVGNWMTAVSKKNRKNLVKKKDLIVEEVVKVEVMIVEVKVAIMECLEKQPQAEEELTSEKVDQDKEIIDLEKEVIDQEKEVIDQEKEVIDQEKEVIDQEKEVIDQEKEVIDQEKEFNDQEKEFNDQEKEFNDQEMEDIDQEKEVIGHYDRAQEEEQLTTLPEVTATEPVSTVATTEEDNNNDELTEHGAKRLARKAKKKAKKSEKALEIVMTTSNTPVESPAGEPDESISSAVAPVQPQQDERSVDFSSDAVDEKVENVAKTSKKKKKTPESRKKFQESPVVKNDDQPSNRDEYIVQVLPSSAIQSSHLVPSIPLTSSEHLLQELAVPPPITVKSSLTQVQVGLHSLTTCHPAGVPSISGIKNTFSEEQGDWKQAKPTKRKRTVQREH